jgi:hypothetical protein
MSRWQSLSESLAPDVRLLVEQFRRLKLRTQRVPEPDGRVPDAPGPRGQDERLLQYVLPFRPENP